MWGGLSREGGRELGPQGLVRSKRAVLACSPPQRRLFYRNPEPLEGRGSLQVSGAPPESLSLLHLAGAV